MFGSLRVRNYRLFASGQVISNVGTWMQRIAQDWLVLELSGYDPVALGVAAALQFLPTLLFTLWAGVLADRHDKRMMLILVQSGMAACALALGLLDVTGLVVLWHVYLLCFVFGMFTAVDPPVRQAFVGEMVGKDNITNAVALNSSMFNLARVVGPAIAGVMIIWTGTGWVFLVNAVTTLAVITNLARMNPAELERQPKPASRRGQLREALRYVRTRPDILTVLVMVFFVSTFAFTFFTTLAIAAANVFHREADGYGLLSTLLAVGSLTGSLLAVRRSTRRAPGMRLLIGSAFVFGLLEALTGLMPSYLLFGLALIPTGIAMITFMNTANSVVQLATTPEMRGRVMALYMLVFIGGNPVGAPMTGWLAAEFGGRSPFVIGGVIAALAAVACGVYLGRRGGLITRLRRSRVVAGSEVSREEPAQV
ncbi:MFS transporter [Actinophytocola xinjiangensis]|uniref:MFS transporter n=1 Tax=Actinophytocola xinjiangensis TaxID=485602 RepID=A0A7Z0WKA6_9PSEU|nr:MFS transporter [Actinophytocola xinjiangensis]OLF09337.1 MFS transporter [Actinophytocola xinjiangensis]